MTSDLDAMARRVIDGNHHMTLACSSPEARHSRNLGERPDVLRGAAPLRLYVARVSSCEVHVPGSHPVHGRGVDTRQAADPRR